jgi:hypothetical protein
MEGTGQAAEDMIVFDGTEFSPQGGIERIKQITFNKDTADATGTTAYTGVGFKPTAAVATACIDNSDEWSVGVSDGGGASSTNEGGVADRNGVSATQHEPLGTFIGLKQSSGVSYGGIISSLDADGFTVSWTKTGAKTGLAICHVLCFR